MNEKKKLRGLPQRILSFVLTLMMVLTLMPSMEANAMSFRYGASAFTYNSSNGTISATVTLSDAYSLGTVHRYFICFIDPAALNKYNVSPSSHKINKKVQVKQLLLMI